MTTPTQDFVLTMERTLGAPPDRVYRAWTDEAEVTRWIAPDPSMPTTAELDVRVGGTYVIHMADFVVRGVYRELETRSQAGLHLEVGRRCIGPRHARDGVVRALRERWDADAARARAPARCRPASEARAGLDRQFRSSRGVRGGGWVGTSPTRSRAGPPRPPMMPAVDDGSGRGRDADDWTRFTKHLHRVRRPAPARRGRGRVRTRTRRRSRSRAGARARAPIP